MEIRKGKKRSDIWGWIPLAFAVWVLIFGTYEVIERTLLKEVSFRITHILHIVRGTGTSFILASLVAWYMIRRGVREESESRAEKLKPFAFGQDYQEELERRLYWLIRLRWVAITGCFLTIAFTYLILNILSSYSVFALVLITLVMVGYNIGFQIVLKHLKAPKAIAFSQVFLDLISLTLMLHFSGGIENPFFAFFVFHVIIASILLRKQESYFITTVTCLLFSSMVILEYGGLIHHYPLRLSPQVGIFIPGSGITPYYILGILVAFVATTMFSTYFAATIMENLRHRQQDLIETSELLGQEKAKLDDIVQSIGAGLRVLDRDYRTVWYNDKIKEWFGEEVKCCEEKGIPDCPVQVAFETGKASSWQQTFIVNGSERRFLLITSSLIKDSKGEVTHALELVQDITRMKEMEIQLIQAGKMVAIGELASGIAHEINNPLATVAASAELLREIAGDEKLLSLKKFAPFPRHLQRIEEHVYRCKEIIKSLLGFARKEEVGVTKVLVNEVIQETLKLLGERARSSGKEIIWSYAQDMPPIQANPRQLQQVFINIIMNALDAIEGQGTISIKSFQQDGVITVEISDTGKGIPPEHLSRIFDPFFTTKSPGKGTGLGLYLCHQIIESLNGNITVTSCPGKGSTFLLSIPIKSN